jgi:hypothetical protein
VTAADEIANAIILEGLFPTASRRAAKSKESADGHAGRLTGSNLVCDHPAERPLAVLSIPDRLAAAAD